MLQSFVQFIHALYSLHVPAFSAIFIGFMSAIVSVNSIFSLVFRTKGYVYTTLLIICISIVTICYRNIYTILLLPTHRIVSIHTFLLFIIVIMTLLYILVSKALLNINNKTNPKTYIILQILIYIGVILLLTCVFSPYTITLALLGLYLAISIIAILYISFLKALSKKLEYIVHCISTFSFSLYASILSLKFLQYLQLESITEEYIQMTVMLFYSVTLVVCTALHIIRDKQNMLFSQSKQLHHIKKLFNEQKNLAQANKQFVGDTFAFILNKKNITHIKAGDTIKRNMSIMSVQIDNLHHITSHFNPDELTLLFTLYHKHLMSIANHASGYTHRHSARRLLILFIEENSEKAIQVAEQILQTKNVLEKELRTQIPILNKLSITIGIHFTKAMFGIVGEKDTGLAALLLGNEEIQSQRLSYLNNIFHTQCLLSKAAFQNLPKNTSYALRKIPTLFIKQLEKEQEIYELFEGNATQLKQNKKETLCDYNKAIEQLYKKQYPECISLLKLCLKKVPNDSTIQNLLKRILQYIHSN